jgi:hypothetical protein
MAMSRINGSGGRPANIDEAIFEWEEYLPLQKNFLKGSSAFTHVVRAAGGIFKEALACPDPRCVGGGFEVEVLLQSMFTERLEEKSGLLVCAGWDRRTAGMAEGVPCTRAIRYQIRVRYRGPVRLAT